MPAWEPPRGRGPPARGRQDTVKRRTGLRPQRLTTRPEKPGRPGTACGNCRERTRPPSRWSLNVAAAVGTPTPLPGVPTANVKPREGAEKGRRPGNQCPPRRESPNTKSWESVKIPREKRRLQRFLPSSFQNRESRPRVRAGKPPNRPPIG